MPERVPTLSWPPRLALGLCLLLILVGIPLAVLLLRPTERTATDPPACTTTITASSGSVQEWLTTAQPGRVLCLAPGTYTGGGQMLTIASGQGGTDSDPIWIRAQHEGTVLIDGQFGQRPLDCNGHDVIVWGVNLRDGNDSTLVLRGTRCQARRVVAWSTAATWGIDNVIDLGGTHNVLEDGAAFGYARKMVAAGARGGRSGNVIRRVWLEHNGFTPSPGSDPGSPTNPLEVGYDQDLVTVENALIRRHILSSATQPEAPLSVFSTWDSWIGGSIVYLQPGDHMDTTTLGAFFPEGGSHEGSGHATSRTTVTNTLFYAPPSFPTVAAFWMSGSSQGSGNRMETVVAVAPGSAACGAPGWTCTQVKAGTNLPAVLGSTSPWLAVPGICTRYRDRQLTTEPLWPWPTDARIRAALVLAERAPYSVTGALESLLGAIPAPCRTPGTPVPPEPTPPATSLRCRGQLASVPGTVQLDCQPTGGAR